jgi:hypothetical protein
VLGGESWGVERAEAEAILDGARETAVALLLGIGELVEANERLEARVAELERRLKRSSRNSSLPPSQDPPSAPPRPRPMEFATRALRAWSVPYVVPTAAAARVFDPSGQVRDNGVETQLRPLGREVVRVAERFTADSSVQRAERVGPAWTWSSSTRRA